MKPEIDKNLSLELSIAPVYDLEKGKEGGEYFSISPWITKENCPIIAPGEKKIEETKVMLVNFGYRGMKTEDVLAALDEKNMVPAGLQHLLGLGMKHSEWHIQKNDRIRQIIPLGQTFSYKDKFFDFDSIICMNCPSIVSRNLSVTGYKKVCWYPITSFFLAIAK